jgi:type VI secretion system protein ImpA
MASPPFLDIEPLLAPIPGDNPAGESLPFIVRKKLDDARKEINPNSFAPDDPLRPEAPQLADWPGIVQLAQDTLTQTSKDLLVTARLTEALVKLHGFGGLRDAIKLFRGLIDQCWDRIYPEIEDGDVEARAAAFNWLDDDVRGARFPNVLRTVPLTQASEEQRYGWQHWKDAQDAKGTVTAEAFDQAISATARDYCQFSVDDLGACITELDQLTESLSSRMGTVAPGMSLVRKALLECQQLAQMILQRKGPAPSAVEEGAEPASEADGAVQGTAPAAAPRRMRTREDVLNQLAEASALLLQMEPHSPVPYLVQRAVKLARLPLPQLMRVLIRDPNVLSQLDRDLDLGFEGQDGGG